jgi:hypothetical protein
MGEILGIGCSHGPGITGPLTRLTDIYLRRNLQSELTPVHMKDPKNWPRKMQEEWDGDEGLAFAAEYQRILQPAYRKARECIDESSRILFSFLVTISMRFSKKTVFHPSLYSLSITFQ